MKALLVVCVAALLALGCDDGKPTTVKSVGSWEGGANVLKNHYEGHDYLLFKFKTVQGGGVEHDPNCQNENCIALRKVKK